MNAVHSRLFRARDRISRQNVTLPLLVALRYNDVDLEKGMLQVRHNLTWVRGMGYVESEPKTKTGRRKIMLSNVAVAALKEHQVKQEGARIKMGD